jgi:hypothetical protein
LRVLEVVIEDFGQVIKRLNEKFGTTFSLFRHDEENVNKLFAGMETHRPARCTARSYGSASSTPRRPQGENKRRNTIRPAEPETKEAFR